MCEESVLSLTLSAILVKLQQSNSASYLLSKLSAALAQFQMFLSKFLAAADHPYLMGKGGRKMNNITPPQGLSVASLKHHVALQPLFVIMGVGIVFVCAYVGRYTQKHTESSNRFS